jgi:hypothetical protein
VHQDKSRRLTKLEAENSRIFRKLGFFEFFEVFFKGEVGFWAKNRLGRLVCRVWVR